ncbi:MAG TPA: tetratricopeptide repeat protein [Gammaproteobacteria bacterium]
MHRKLTTLVLVFAAGAASADSARDGLKDLYFGEALFYANQADWFAALERLDTELAQHYGVDEPMLDTLHYHVNDAEFSVGDFELNYRMHHRAGRAITAVLEGDVDEPVRNEAAFRLARIHFQKGQFQDALNALDRIEGRMPAGIRDEVEFLRANIFMATDRPEGAVDTLRPLEDADGLDGFAAYNLGIALLRNDRRREALEQLDRAGQFSGTDEAGLAVRDKSNLVLGTLLMEAEAFSAAAQSLDRVRLDGPFSNQALLSSGWAAASAQNYERAIVPWSILADRESTDGAVQEAKLALPFAYSQLNVHGRAAVLYGNALESFDAEVDKLDASIESIREGRFLEALVREEIRQNEDWVIRLRSLPQTPETYYLMELLASHDFQTALQNYLDLEDLRTRLEFWQRGFDAFEDMVDLRRRHYEPLLPEIDQEFRELDSRIRLRREQYSGLNARLQQLLVAPRPDFLATTEERLLSADLGRVEQSLGDGAGPEIERVRERVRRLRGALTWTLWTEYHERLTDFHEHLRELADAIDVMTAQYGNFVRTRQAAVHSYEGYDVPIRRLRTRVGDALANLRLLMARQGHVLELVAIDELDRRRVRLLGYRDEARFALANSYDRATTAHAVIGQE